ncbi:glutamine synthetase family protein, partial [Patescibacteria group bacterium]|nr:glutamine synthetase family protein [Patescibacteria group bacterium]
MTIGEIKKLVKEKEVQAISLWFTDVLGQLKTVTVSYKEINDVLENGKFIDGSSIEGFSRIQESDLLLLPDFNTFAVIPFDMNGGTKIARLICDVAYPDGSPFEACPRQTLKRVLQKAEEKGYTQYCGPELEYFYFKTPEGTELLDRGGYFDLLSIDEGTKIRERTLSILEKMGIQCECAHHEVAPSSHEIGLKYKEALEMADTVLTYKFIVKAVAQEHEVYATFMPKPIAGENGSGMHTHLSLFKGDTNTFYDANDDYSLSSTARSYVAGLLKYAPEFTMVANQYINSYKRLVPGYEAPVYIAWGRANRTALVRVPATRPGKEKACRAEYRAADPACNPYLTFACFLGAGLKGIEENLELMPIQEEDIFEMNNKEREEKGIMALPGSLLEAKDNFEKSEL